MWVNSSTDMFPWLLSCHLHVPVSLESGTQPHFLTGFPPITICSWLTKINDFYSRSNRCSLGLLGLISGNDDTMGLTKRKNRTCVVQSIFTPEAQAATTTTTNHRTQLQNRSKFLIMLDWHKSSKPQIPSEPQSPAAYDLPTNSQSFTDFQYALVQEIHFHAKWEAWNRKERMNHCKNMTLKNKP